ncbi:hypothetical protein Dthio_PD1384 [Desulfonatronospira thiodismutans ASO3-1]|uniref:Uncharacterized protein n=1 Tax=Desulfonatronospira thiodismutans ASO3-1 TaxID=555779 RepID=D6STM9_9BACT|nr:MULTISPECIES: hypothetical protein [Desulfonatronospira]EFI34045.1 hypothetical protein Dthio_PD1384 [Desulfonatronospira thiodismutans ASO3-1]
MVTEDDSPCREWIHFDHKLLSVKFACLQKGVTIQGMPGEFDLS